MRRFRPIALLATAGLLLSGMSVATAATAPDTPAWQGQTGSWKVTLLTGDVVRVHAVTGKPPMVSVTPGAGRKRVQFVKSIRPDGTVTVIPVDVGPQVGTVLDPALFNVTALIKDGDDDARRDDLPLIVQTTGATPSYLKEATRAKAAHPLKGISAIALHQPKAKPLNSQLRSGVRHIWLDRQVHATVLRTAATGPLDGDLTQIGAPAAWRAGDTGKDVKVAVLDTGVDATHPDLKGQIAEAKNFSESADTVDRFGHGTHVAATIAGTGAAAKGQRRGVAYGAKLVIGKVLGDDGEGSESDVIAGMEWAATQAKIVNMSLGSDDVDPANDPVADAVTALSAKYGTLFVVAAGNSGPGVGTVGTPGVADAALTVGAVDGADKVADFSSVGGPQSKPDIAAPGVETIAARAAGTSMGTIIDANYTAASGNSMATPHVTGAVAVLAQEHPDWPGQRLKDALIASAHPVGGTTFQVGAGRLDLAAAIRTTVVPDQPAAAFGTLSAGSAPVAKALSWTNTGTTPVTLPLRVQGPGTLSADHITVPARGSASATLTIDPARLSTGFHSGMVTAGALRTPIGLYLQSALHTVTLKATALPGDSPYIYASIVDLSEPDLLLPVPDFDDTGTATLRLPAGRYSVLAGVGDSDSGGVALVAEPEVTVDGDTTVPLDATKAWLAKATAPGFTADEAVVHAEQTVNGWTWGMDAYGTAGKIFAVPSRTVDVGTFRAYAGFWLTDSGGTTVYDLLHDLGDRIPATIDYRVDPAALARIDQRFYAVDGTTTTSMSEHRYGLSPAGFLVTETGVAVAPGSTRTDYVSAEPGVRWLDEASSGLLDKVSDWGWVSELPARHFEPGSRQTSEWFRGPFRPGPYSGTAESPSFCTPRTTFRSSGDIHVRLVDLQNLPDGFDCTTDDQILDGYTSHTMRLYADGTQVGTVNSTYADFTVPATAGTYRLTYDTDFGKVLPASTKTSTAWTFRSAPPAARNGTTPVPLLTVGYALPLNLLNQPDGETATFTVARVAGTPAATVTGFKLWTSADDGTTWTPAVVRPLGGGRFGATLPTGHLSLRVDARDSGGSRIEQTIIHAY
jgi:subtilisin family serine protease